MPGAPELDTVRPFDSKTDAKTVKMLIGQGVMEGLAAANQRGKHLLFEHVVP